MTSDVISNSELGLRQQIFFLHVTESGSNRQGGSHSPSVARLFAIASHFQIGAWPDVAIINVFDCWYWKLAAGLANSKRKALKTLRAPFASLIAAPMTVGTHGFLHLEALENIAPKAV